MPTITFKGRIKKYNQIMRRWLNYFKYASMQKKLVEIDGWVRNRLRYCIWHHWKKPDKKMRSLIRLGKEPFEAYQWSRFRMGGWMVACSPILGTTITIARLQKRGYISSVDYYTKIHTIR